MAGDGDAFPASTSNRTVPFATCDLDILFVVLRKRSLVDLAYFEMRFISVEQKHLNGRVSAEDAYAY